jgi:hypothetical protein
MATTKKSVAYRISKQAEDHLNRIVSLTGMTKTAAVELAITKLSLSLGGDNKMDIKITRNNRNLGVGYTTTTYDDNSPCTRPIYTGAPKQVLEALDDDMTLRSFRSGGTFHRIDWFVKFDGEWKRVVWDDFGRPRDLCELVPFYRSGSGSDRMVYATDSITAHVV